jgi:hypothetical protein
MMIHKFYHIALSKRIAHKKFYYNYFVIRIIGFRD